MSAQRKADDVALLGEAIGQYRHDPLGYARFNWQWGKKGTPLEGKSLRKWQERQLGRLGELLRAGVIDPAGAIRMARASGHGIGKSALVSIVIKWALDTVPDTRGVITANTDNQLRTKTWAEVAKWHNLSLTFALAMSGCKSGGGAVEPPKCPELAPIPASLTGKTDYVRQVQDELFEPSAPAKPSATPY